MTSKVVRFAPWVGSDYERGLKGLRLLIVGESHYGSKPYERPTVTPEVIKASALRQKHPLATVKPRKHSHFAKIMASTLSVSKSSSISGPERKDFWSRVAYYNFIQEFLAKPRVAPSQNAWSRSEGAFLQVLEVLRPQLIICYSIRNGERVRKLAGPIPVAVVNHPSSRFAYSKANPVIAAQFEAAIAKVEAETAFAGCNVFQGWRALTNDALPSRGKYMADLEREEALTRWAALMSAIDSEACVSSPNMESLNSVKCG